MAPLLGALIKLAPAAIKFFAKSKGKEGVGDIIADAVSKAIVLPERQRESAVAQSLAGLSSDDMKDVIKLNSEAAVAIRMEEESTKRKQEETYQVQLNTESLEAKRIRPMIAKQSWYISAAYAILTTLAIPILTPFVDNLTAIEFEWIVFVALFSPAATFMGIRGMERWKAGGTPA